MKEGYFLYASSLDDKECFLTDIENIYFKMNDEVSKTIFKNRVLYSMFLEPQYLRNIVMETSIGIQFAELLHSVDKEARILIYGAGKCGKQLVEMFPEVHWNGFIDQNKTGYIAGIKINRLDDYENLSDSKVIISNQMGYKDIAGNLLSHGVKKENIICLEEWNVVASKEQYFEERCLSLENISTFVDIGSFDGTDSMKFLDKKGSYVEKIWAFEPDKRQFEICLKRLKAFRQVQVLNSGIGSKSYKGKIVLRDNSGSFITREDMSEGEEADIVTLDEMLSEEKIDFVKMDVEGFEEMALLGGAELLRKQKPKLAVSIYHKRDDIFKIPRIVLDINPEYQFALGHYSLRNVDTVLYAW